MALSLGPNLGQLVHGDPGEEHYARVTALFRALDALVQPRAISATVTTPPAAPSDGDCYIVPKGAGGVWASHIGCVARWSNIVGWEYYEPRQGWVVAVDGPPGRMQFDATAGEWYIAQWDNDWTTAQAQINADIARAGLTSGELMERLELSVEALNSAALVRDAAGRSIGLSIPAGASGASSYVRGTLGMDISQLVGCHVRITTRFTASTGFLSATPIGSLRLQVKRGGALINVAPDAGNESQSGNTLEKWVSYTIQSGDQDLAFVLQLGASVSAAARSLSLVSCVCSISDNPGSLMTGSDIQFDQRLDAALEQLPSAAGLTSGDVLATTVVTGEALGGATAVKAARGYVGFNIPPGSSGASSYILAKLPLTAAELAARVGTQIEIAVQYTATDNLLSQHSVQPRLQIGRGTSYANVKPDWYELTQAGTVISYKLRYTLQAGDLYLAPFYQLSGATLSSVRELTIAAVSYHYRQLANSVLTGDDLILDQRLAAALSSTAAVTSGELATGALMDAQVFNGATIVSAGGRAVGFEIPAGSTGATSYIRAQLQLGAALPGLVGRTLRITSRYRATAEFLSAVPVAGLRLQLKRGNSLVSVTPTAVADSQAGDYITRHESYTIQAGDLDIALVYQVGTPVAVATARHIELSSCVYSVDNDAGSLETGSDLAVESRLAPLRSAVQGASLTSGELLGAVVYWNGQGLNGAIPQLSGGSIQGLTIPAGQSGAQSYFSPYVQIDGAALAGATLIMTAIYEASADFIAQCPPSTIRAQARRAGVNNVVAAVSRFSETQTGTRLVKQFDYVIQATDEWIAPTYQIAANAVARDSERSLRIVGFSFTLSNVPGTRTSADVLVDQRISQAVAHAASNTATAITVAPSGAQYTSPDLANAAITGASASQPYTIQLAAGEYDTSNLQLKNNVSLVGAGAARTIIRHELPDNVDPATIPNTQTLWINETSTLEGVSIYARNMRYPIHSDSGGQSKNGRIIIRDCHIEHLGNQGASDYQKAHGGGSVWASEHAWGYGSSSGQTLLIERTTLKSRGEAFYAHTNRDFAAPSRMVLNNNRLIATGTGTTLGYAVYVQPLGSGQPDVVELNGNQLVGDIYYWCNPWMPTALDNQPADHSEIQIIGHGNSPAVFKILEPGRALKIESRSTSDTSRISVGGSAVPVLFGKTVYELPGAGGIPGYVYGWADISGSSVGSPSVGNITSLGKRLGDCRTAPLLLKISVDGAAALTVTFDQDYTAATNTTILAAINTVLGSAALASAYNVGGRYRPALLDEEAQLLNSSTEGVLMGSAVAYDGHHQRIRKMTAADAPELFAGIAWADIYPGTWGRVKTRGYLPTSDILGGVGTLTFGQRLYVDPAQPGRLTTATGTHPILRAIRADAVEVAA